MLRKRRGGGVAYFKSLSTFFADVTVRGINIFNLHNKPLCSYIYFYMYSYIYLYIYVCVLIIASQTAGQN